MTAMSQDSLLEFPCDFPIKIMGKQQDGFRDLAVSIVEAHVGKLDASATRSTASRDEKFLSVTVTVTASSQQQLDAIFQSLSDHPSVLMVL